jgi:hypothetical protein
VQFDIHKNIGKQRDTIPFVAVLHPLEMISVTNENLGEKVATLAQEGDRITGVMDELLTRAWA